MMYIPYGRQTIDEEDIQAVCEILKSDFLTTGPQIGVFESCVAEFVGTEHAVAMSSGTAALHGCMYALGIQPGDEVIVPPITFAATANAVCYLGGTPVFADVDPETLLIDPDQVHKKITDRTKAVVGVDYTGQPCQWDALRDISKTHHLPIIADSCHALGAEFNGARAGSLADMSVFSFHPVKHVATGEGGMVTTNNQAFAEKLRLFRNHGISTDAGQREKTGAWRYEMIDLGFNYRITDIQCALGISQMKKLPDFLAKRKKIAAFYDEVFQIKGIRPLKVECGCTHAYHLYVVKVLKEAGLNRDTVFGELRQKGIGVNVHYIPVHLHPFYKRQFGYGPGLCPVAESEFEQILSLPIWPGMSQEQVHRVAEAVLEVTE